VLLDLVVFGEKIFPLGRVAERAFGLGRFRGKKILLGRVAERAFGLGRFREKNISAGLKLEPARVNEEVRWSELEYNQIVIKAQLCV